MLEHDSRRTRPHRAAMQRAVLYTGQHEHANPGNDNQFGNEIAMRRDSTSRPLRP
jgi:hypothetical protein